MSELPVSCLVLIVLWDDGGGGGELVDEQLAVEEGLGPDVHLAGGHHGPADDGCGDCCLLRATLASRGIAWKQCLIAESADDS